MKFMRLFALWIVAALLAGCDPTVGTGTSAENAKPEAPRVTQKGLKPGMTAAQFANRKQFPEGYRIRQKLVKTDGTELLDIDVQAFNNDNNGVILRGSILLPPPEGVDQATLRDIAKRMSASNLVRNGKINAPFTAILDKNHQAEEVISFFNSSYTPHDCSMTLGKCKFTRVSNIEGRERRSATLTESNGIWHSVVMGRDPNGSRMVVVAESYFTLDQYGFLKSSNTWRLSKDGVEETTIRPL